MCVKVTSENLIMPSSRSSRWTTFAVWIPKKTHWIPDSFYLPRIGRSLLLIRPKLSAIPCRGWSRFILLSSLFSNVRRKLSLKLNSVSGKPWDNPAKFITTYQSICYKFSKNFFFFTVVPTYFLKFVTSCLFTAVNNGCSPKSQSDTLKLLHMRKSHSKMRRQVCIICYNNAYQTLMYNNLSVSLSCHILLQNQKFNASFFAFSFFVASLNWLTSSMSHVPMNDPSLIRNTSKWTEPSLWKLSTYQYSYFPIRS